MILKLRSSQHASHASPAQYIPTQRLAQDPTAKPHFPPRAAPTLAVLAFGPAAGEIPLRLALDQEEVYQYRYDGAAENVIRKADRRLEAKDAGADAEKEGRYRADI